MIKWAVVGWLVDSKVGRADEWIGMDEEMKEPMKKRLKKRAKKKMSTAAGVGRSCELANAFTSTRRGDEDGDMIRIGDGQFVRKKGLEKKRKISMFRGL